MTKEQHEVGATARNLAVVVRVARATAAAIALTEVNPSYDPGGHQLARYVDAVAGAIAHGPAMTHR